MGMNRYSQTTAMFAIAKASLISILRSPSAVVFSLLFPLVFIVVFGFVGSGSVKVKVALLPGSGADNKVMESLRQLHVVKWVEGLDEVEINKRLKGGQVDAALKVTCLPGEVTPFAVDVFYSAAAGEKSMVFQSLIQNRIGLLNQQAIHQKPVMARLQEATVRGREYKMIDFILPGQLGFSLLSSGVFGTAFVFLSLRQTLVIKRFFATPVKRPYIILGETLSRIVFSLIGSLFIILAGHFAFGFTLVHGALTVISMLLLSALGLVVFMGFGFVVSGIAKNESSVPPIANIITLPQFLLSGTFFSVDSFPGWLQPLCKALPLTHLNDAMRKVSFEGAGLWDIAPQLGIVILWGFVVYALAVKFFRWE